MSFWSRVAGLGRAKTPSDDTVGSELWDGLQHGGLAGSGIPVNSFTAMQHVAVMACVTVLSEDFAKLPLRLFRRLPRGGKEVATDHPLHILMRRPNAWQTRLEWIEMMQAALVLRGNAYAVKIRDDRGRVLQLVPVHPDRVTIFEAAGGDWFYMVTRQGLHEMAVLRDMPLMIHHEDMFHLKWMSTWNSLLGSSRIQLMREAIGLGMGQEKMAAQLVGSGARPGGVLQTDRKLSPEAFDRVKSSWQASHGGWRNSGKTAILEEGLKWEALGMTMVDAEFMASRRYQLEDIARGFRVPLYKLGVSREGVGSSQVQQDQSYVNDVLSLYGQRWSERLEVDFDIDGDEYFIELDYEHLLKADLQTRLTAKRTGVVGMIYTPNEARRGEGLPGVEGGDVLYQPTNVAPIGFTPAAPSGSEPAGPGSDVTGEPAIGGDGDGSRPADDDTAPNKSQGSRPLMPRAIPDDGKRIKRGEVPLGPICSPDQEFAKKEAAQILAAAIERLPSREAQITKARYGFDGYEPETLGAIARRLGISSNRVRQIEQKAMQRLRKASGIASLLEAFRDESAPNT